MTINHQQGHRQRLKDRFLIDDGKSMADYEFLELVLFLAIPRKDVKPLAKELISKFGSYTKTICADAEELLEVNGVSKSVITVFRQFMASSQRMGLQKLCEDNESIISNFDNLIDFCITTMGHKKVECFSIFYADAKNKVIGFEELQSGTIDAVYVHPREVINSVIKAKAKSVFLVHNHPSGKLTPSKADIAVTKQIIEALQTIEVSVWDHIIIGDGGYYSFKDHNLID